MAASPPATPEYQSSSATREPAAKTRASTEELFALVDVGRRRTAFDLDCRRGKLVGCRAGEDRFRLRGHAVPVVEKATWSYRLFQRRFSDTTNPRVPPLARRGLA